MRKTVIFSNKIGAIIRTMAFTPFLSIQYIMQTMSNFMKFEDKAVFRWTIYRLDAEKHFTLTSGRNFTNKSILIITPNHKMILSKHVF